MFSVRTRFVVFATVFSLNAMYASAGPQTAVALPITLKLGGSWESGSSTRNVSVTATFDGASLDQNPWNRIGAYQLSSVTFGFTQLGKFSTPFELCGDVSQSQLHLYPSSEGIPTGEVRMFGRFDTIAPFPNGILPTEYDLRMYFTSLPDDSLSALSGVGNLMYSSRYLTDQIGGRSSNFLQSDLQVIQSAVPEPATYALFLTGLGLICYTTRRRRLIQNNSDLLSSSPRERVGCGVLTIR